MKGEILWTDIYNKCWDVTNSYIQAFTNLVLSNVRSRTRAIHYVFASVLPCEKICPCRLRIKYLTCLPRKNKLFWQLKRLDDFTISHICTSFRSWKTEHHSILGTFNTFSRFTEVLRGLKLTGLRNELV